MARRSIRALDRRATYGYPTLPLPEWCSHRDRHAFWFRTAVIWPEDADWLECSVSGGAWTYPFLDRHMDYPTDFGIYSDYCKLLRLMHWPSVVSEEDLSTWTMDDLVLGITSTYSFATFSSRSNKLSVSDRGRNDLVFALGRWYQNIHPNCLRRRESWLLM